MLRMATETWLQTLWQQLVVQYETTDTKLMAGIMQRQMAIGNSSCLYRIQAVTHNKHYEGLVQDRPAGLRSREHSTAIIDWQSRSELRYKYMFGKGGPGAWWFIPIVCSNPGTVVPLRQLEKLEKQRICQTQHSLNTLGTHSHAKASTQKPHQYPTKASATETVKEPVRLEVHDRL